MKNSNLKLIFLKKYFFRQKKVQKLLNFKKKIFLSYILVTYQITIKFHEKLKFEMKFFKKIFLRQNKAFQKLQKLLNFQNFHFLINFFV